MSTSTPDRPSEAVALAEPRLAVPGLRQPAGPRVGTPRQPSRAPDTPISPIRPTPVAEAMDASAQRALRHWLRSQKVNAVQSLQLLRDFRMGEFGSAAGSPGAAHLHAANRLLKRVRDVVSANANALVAACDLALQRPDRARLDRVSELKEEGATLMTQAEKIWHGYWSLFGQRQGGMLARLLAADRIALDCYQYVYQGLGRARPIPSPPPLSYMEAGAGPATYRRGVRLSKLGMFPNPFPLVKLPDHRLVTPWTLGAIPHEVAHNLQADLGLWTAVPRRLMRAMRAAGLPLDVRRPWVRWQKEIFADLLSVLLIGPAYVGSITDVVAKSPRSTVAWNPMAVHPTPFLRVLINLELLRRMDFRNEARALRRAWFALHPPARATTIPFALRRAFRRSVGLVVDVLADSPYAQLGGKSLRQVVCFRPQDQQVAVEAAHRLARGADPGIVPERFLLSAVRHAFDRGLATPVALTRNFYATLGRR